MYTLFRSRHLFDRPDNMNTTRLDLGIDLLDREYTLLYPPKTLFPRDTVRTFQVKMPFVLLDNTNR